MTAPVAPLFDGTQPCAQTDPEAFFPDSGGNPRLAKQVCTGCEFREPCLEYALTADVAGYPIAGIWGGTTAVERVRLRKANGTARADVRAERAADRDRRIRELFEGGMGRNVIASRLGLPYQTVYAATRPLAAPEPVIDHQDAPLDEEIYTVDEEHASRLQKPAALRRVAAAQPEPSAPPSSVHPPRPPAPMPNPAPATARRWHPTELADAVRALTAAGFTPTDIARELGVPVSAVRRHRKAAA